MIQACANTWAAPAACWSAVPFRSTRWSKSSMRFTDDYSPRARTETGRGSGSWRKGAAARLVASSGGDQDELSIELLFLGLCGRVGDYVPESAPLAELVL